ncbi:MAG: hypothetical protein WBZ48_12365 [Bacteroidota bacterium]
MFSEFRWFGFIALCFCVVETALSQTEDFHGQASGWASANHDSSPGSQGGLRYIPDLLVEQKLSDQFDANMELSLNAFTTAQYAEGQPPTYEGQIKPYRGWIRLSTDKFEMRVGLQKINFGSAMIFRPLMWFDRVDPRDPLQLTDGVYAMLLRYSFLNNANIWLWGLYGNNDTKGWELVPTEKKTSEFGGRVQSPLWSGEIGLTYHHRRADLSPLIRLPIGTGSLIAPEDRLGLDGKWDVGIGLWFESVMIRQESDFLQNKYQRQGTVGADYTFDVGNGLYVATEYFRSDNPKMPFGSGDGTGFSALSANYPLGVVDQVSAILYRDWNNEEWYRLLTWQRTYDNWSFYLIGFWDPENILLYSNQAGTNPFAGTGFQVMVVFNH